MSEQHYIVCSKCKTRDEFEASHKTEWGWIPCPTCGGMRYLTTSEVDAALATLRQRLPDIKRQIEAQCDEHETRQALDMLHHVVAFNRIHVRPGQDFVIPVRVNWWSKPSVFKQVKIVIGEGENPGDSHAHRLGTRDCGAFGPDCA